MIAEKLLDELGEKLGFPVTLSDQGTCRILFDEDAVDFELSGQSLYVIADIASASNRQDACARFLEANFLGRETGGACLGLDTTRDCFTLHRTFGEGTDYPAFEEGLALFVKALRYWKEWLALPPAKKPSEATDTAAVMGQGMMMV